MHLAKLQAFQQFLFEFHITRDYFECHEIFEDLWKEIAPRQKQHELVGFILLATGMYHWRRGNNQGGSRSFQKAYALLNRTDVENNSFLSKFDQNQLLQLVAASGASCENGEPYQSILLPLRDETLQFFLNSFPLEKKPVSNEIVHKHRLRDRSEVISERERAKQQRHSTH
ncbi:DUF309 domain-containing protein [Chryseomicrobium palamuruense]|uniref:DUF309 domain-containing protein n=1 Tax=Chryseomicrobium palamuruense TaxID=682973 RepID=A0ABV8UUP7_9BACL